MFPTNTHWVQNANQNQQILPFMSFNSFLAGRSIVNPILPLVHTTKARIFEEHIIPTNQLKPILCPCFNQELLYFFYGRPAYRISCDVNIPMPPEIQPICIILKPTTAINVKSIFPFDSGACHAGLYDKHLNWININNFDLGSNLETALELVSVFFNTNIDYIQGSVVPGIHIPPGEAEVSAYYNLINNMTYSLPLTADDRRHSIEVQSPDVFNIQTAKKGKKSAKIKVDGNILAVIAPNDFLRKGKIRNVITKDWMAQPIPYYPASSHRIDEIHGMIWGSVTTFFDDKGYL